MLKATVKYHSGIWHLAVSITTPRRNACRLFKHVKYMYIVYVTNIYWIPCGSSGKKIPERRIKARKQGHLTIGGTFICRNMIG